MKFYPALFLCAMMFMATPVFAMDQPSYDLDSLVYMSSDIVDADLGASHTDGNVGVTDVTVTHVYQGQFKVGQVVEVTALDFFDIPKASHVTLFLAKAHAVFLYDIPKDADIYWPAPSGVKLLDQGRIKSFYQYSNPGRYEPEWIDAKNINKLPTLTQFRQQLAKSIRYVDANRAILHAKVTNADEPKLLDILHSRVKPGPSLWGGRWNQDAISQAACDQIASLKDNSALADALAIVQYDNLTEPLDNPDGRAFLVQVVGDASQPLSRRIGCARALAAVYDWSDVDKNSFYVHQIIILLSMTRSTPNLTSAILASLDRIVYEVGSRDKATTSEIIAGLPTLRDLYAKSADESFRFEIERYVLDAAGYDSDKTLNPSGGPVASVVSAPQYPLTDPASPGNFRYRWRIRYAEEKHYDLSPVLVVKSEATGQQWSLPPGREQEGYSTTTDMDMTMQTTLPKNLPRGQYRLFLQFTRSGKIVSTGHYWQTTL